MRQENQVGEVDVGSGIEADLYCRGYATAGRSVRSGPPVHKWKEPERQELMAELDAAYFILYGIKRDDAIYILSTFQGLTDGGRIAVEDAPTVQRILEHYDRLSKIG